MTNSIMTRETQFPRRITFILDPNSREIDIYYVDKYRKISIELSFLQSQEVHVIIGRISAQV